MEKFKEVEQKMVVNFPRYYVDCEYYVLVAWDNDIDWLPLCVCKETQGQLHFYGKCDDFDVVGIPSTLIHRIGISRTYRKSDMLKFDGVKGPKFVIARKKDKAKAIEVLLNGLLLLESEMEAELLDLAQKHNEIKGYIEQIDLL